ncbi:hypothetical protein SEUCBS139899_008689 [Sporothrix eucalyptigena]|uniref:Uncharacterized protein n=1 Tax=Sporothrix eucalyptigena TaxID=1812306 RepID=A0ABP0ANL3_9PEZI
MPPRKTANTHKRQLSVETCGMSSDQGLDSDGDGDFDPVQAATELKKVIDGHKKRRFAIRKKIEKKYETKVAEIVKRTETRLAERDKTKARARQEQMDRLVAAMEVRDAKQRAVADKVGRFYNNCMNLTSLLQTVYAGLAEEAKLAVLDNKDINGETGRV